MKHVWILLAAALLPFPASAQISKFMRTTNFSFADYYEGSARGPGLRTNQLKSQLRGDSGRYLSNDLVSVTLARFEFYPPEGKGTNLVALTPHCIFDRGTRELSSTNSLRLFANDGQLYLEGNSGFLYQMTNNTFYVSNRVRTVIEQSLMQPLTRTP